MTREERRPDYVIQADGGSLVPPGSISREDETLLMAWLNRLFREGDA